MLLPICCHFYPKMEAVRFSEILDAFPILHIQIIVQRVKQEENIKLCKTMAEICCLYGSETRDDSDKSRLQAAQMTSLQNTISMTKRRNVYK
jgi:hypothetical protein